MTVLPGTFPTEYTKIGLSGLLSSIAQLYDYEEGKIIKAKKNDFQGGKRVSIVSDRLTKKGHVFVLLVNVSNKYTKLQHKNIVRTEIS